jgi:hypothetical protein
MLFSSGDSLQSTSSNLSGEGFDEVQPGESPFFVSAVCTLVVRRNGDYIPRTDASTRPCSRGPAKKRPSAGGGLPRRPGGRGWRAVYPEHDRGRGPPERGWLCCDGSAGRGRDRGGSGEVIKDGSFGSQILLRSFARIAF